MIMAEIKKKKDEEAKNYDKNKNLLRGYYSNDDNKRSADLANSIYKLYLNGDREIAEAIASYMLKLDWTDRKRDFSYLFENEIKNLGDEGFSKFIEKVKRKRRGEVLVEKGILSISYNKQSNGVSLSVFLDGNPIIERVDKNTWNVHSHSNANFWYQVQFRDGHAVCPCDDFKYRSSKVGGKCKHIYEVEAVMKMLMLALS